MDDAGGDATVMAQSALVLIHTTSDYDLGMAAIRSAVEANPNDMTVVATAGVVNLCCGDLQAALGFFHRAIQLNPRDPRASWTLSGIAHAHIVLADYTEALAWAARSQALSPDFACNLWMLIAANAHLVRAAAKGPEPDGQCPRRFAARRARVAPKLRRRFGTLWNN